MTQNEQHKKLGDTLWAIANDLRGVMNADDFRDYMLSFLFLRYLSFNYEEAAKRELGKDYPHYYTMRYASIFRPIREVQPSLPDEVTFVRYFFVDKALMAFVMDRQQKHIIEIATTSLEKNISLLTHAATDEATSVDILYNLYHQLWSPISKYVRHKKVVIIPDGILYNLSFDVLTSKKITSFKELATQSLLSKHSLSYRYSLFLLENKTALPALNKSFVAFVPGFSDKMKSDYGGSVSDT